MKHPSGPSQRQLRAGELIRHALADIFLRGETGDPELEKLAVSVVEVQMSPDLRHCHGLCAAADARSGRGPACRRSTATGNISAAWWRRKIEMKFMPEIRFRIDTALDYAGKIDELLTTRRWRSDLEHIEEMKKRGQPVHGWVVLDKPLGMTSTQAVAQGPAAVQCRKGRPWRNARSTGHRAAADCARRGDQDRAMGHGRAENLSIHGRHGARSARPTIWKAKLRLLPISRPSANRYRIDTTSISRRYHAGAAGFFGHQDRRRTGL